MCTSSRIKVHVFCITFVMSISDSIQTHSIIQTSFNMTSTMRSCTIKISDTNFDWFSATFEVRAYWCSKYTELILICRFYTDNRVCTHHVWTNIKACTMTIRRNKVFVCFYNFFYSFKETTFR